VKRIEALMKINKYTPALWTTISGLVIWEALVRLFHISQWLLPAPGNVLLALIEARNLLFIHSIRTLFEAIIGLLLAIMAGLIIGAFIFHFDLLKKAFYPLLVISQTIPIVILIPLLVIWLGYGIIPKMLIVILACFFPVSVNTIDGLSSADREQINLLYSMGATNWQVFKLVQFPSALPAIFSGLKIAATYAVMAAVVAEWMGSDLGLGVFIVRSSSSYLTARVFAGIFLVSLFSILFFQAINLIERKIIPWAKK
jgi:putative hydroxymethylpyrimidine transport system permease protein